MYNENHKCDAPTINPKRDNIWLPIQLSSYIFLNKLTKHFAVYLYLKLHCDGVLHEASPIIKQMRLDLRLKDNRTYDKHIEKLIKLNWIGYNSKSGYYFVRSIKYIKEINDFRNKTETLFKLEMLPQLNCYLAAVIICQKIRAIAHYDRKKRKRIKVVKVANINDKIAIHPDLFHPTSCFLYYGLCAETIGKHLNCSTSHANCLKLAAEKAGFLRTRKHYGRLQCLENPDWRIQGLNSRDWDVKLKGRIRNRRLISYRGKSELMTLIQWHDEIIPKLIFRTIKFQ
jgi:hypothetical protein